MSQYSRNERNANAGIVVGIERADFAQYDNSGSPLAGVALQRHFESLAYELGGRVGDFIANRASAAFGEVQPSYKPGLHLTNLDCALPRYAIDAIREAGVLEADQGLRSR